MRVFMKNHYNYGCDSLDEFLKTFHPDKNDPTRTVNALVDYVSPNTLREGFTLTTWGYQVRTDPSIPVDYPKFKIGDKFKPPDDISYEITHILTRYNYIVYFGKLSVYKTEPRYCTLEEYKDVKIKKVKVTTDHYQVYEEVLINWEKLK